MISKMKHDTFIVMNEDDQLRLLMKMIHNNHRFDFMNEDDSCWMMNEDDQSRSLMKMVHDG